MPNVSVVHASELTPRQIGCWSDVQLANPSLDNPFFRPEFTEAVVRARGDVEVAVLQHGRAPIGFFPFQRLRSGHAQPVAGRLSDLHGVIVDDETDWCVMVDGKRWSGRYKMCWPPVASDDGSHWGVAVDHGSSQTICVDDVCYKETFDKVWSPAFSPSGDAVLIRAVKGNKFIRRVVPLGDILG